MRFPIVKELRKAIGLLLLMAVVIHWFMGVGWALPVYALFIFSLFIARQLPRRIVACPLDVRAPVDGVVVDISETPSPGFIEAGTVLRIRIQQHLFGEFVLHSPIEGKVVERWWPNKLDNGKKNFGFVIKADEGDLCVVDVVNAQRPRFKTHFIASGYRTRQGQRCGLIGMHVLTDVYIAANSDVHVTIGQTVRAGSERIARLQKH